MNHDTIRRIGLLALGVAGIAGATGCHGNQVAATTRATYGYAPDRVFDPALFGDGPALVAGDTLAMRMLIAGSYDINTDPTRRFADAPATTE